MLTDILGKNKVVMVLIYADYCGHCHTYRDDIWNDLVSNKNRKHGMASIHYDQLENTPLANTKVSGYPTVLHIKSQGAEPVEYPESRNKEEMEKILNLGEPGDVLESIQSSTNEEGEGHPRTSETLDLDTNSMEARLAEPNNASNLIKMAKNEQPTMKLKKGARPPNIGEDLPSLNSQGKNSQGKNNSNNTAEFNNQAGEESVPLVNNTANNGSLYNDLLTVAKPARRRHTRRSVKKNLRKSRRKA